MYAAACTSISVRYVSAIQPNLEQNQAALQKICFCQMFSKIIPITPIKSLSGVTASFAIFVLGELWKAKKFFKVDLKVYDKVVESDRPKVGRWRSYGDVCFSTLDEL